MFLLLLHDYRLLRNLNWVLLDLADVAYFILELFELSGPDEIIRKAESVHKLVSILLEVLPPLFAIIRRQHLHLTGFSLTLKDIG